MRLPSNKFIAPALFVLFLDQIIKFLAIQKIIALEFSGNSGALFGVQLSTSFVFVFFAVFLFVAIISFKKDEFKNSAISIAAFYLMLGGIVSNLADRILYGQIIDYIDLFNLFSFNIADLAICFSALILSWKVLICKNCDL
ncbi:MAG: signal peptidase II [Patescibacteria group bacterium]|nr:signal peptidase II [Patescibacteria group bacterium]